MKIVSGIFVLLFSLSICEHVSAYELERVEVADRLLRPWDMAFLSENQVLVTEKEGGLQKVSLLNGSRIDVTGLPLDLDNRNKRGIGDNSGLFAVKLDPEFKKNGLIYLSYAAKNPAGKGSTTKVIRARLEQDNLVDHKTLLVAEPYSEDRFHYGGGLVFGADSKLYITVGERLFTEQDQPEMPIAQNYEDKRGKIYRLNSDGSIPKDNPVFPGQAVSGMFALGIRAAQGLTLHPKSGEIWFSEHGTRQGDELNVLSAGSNYGWPVITTGKYRYLEYAPPALAERQFHSPDWFWEHTVAPTGLAFYYGSEFPKWQGDLFVAGLSRGSLWRITTQGEKVQKAQELFTEQRIRLRNVKMSPAGKIYLLTDEANGRILRIDKR